MSYKLHWIGEEIYGYYFSGVITKNFDIQKENENLHFLLSTDKDIVAVFTSEGNMLLLQTFIPYSESLEEEEELLCYVLDDDLMELLRTHQDDPKISLYVGIIAIQYFQFDTLKDIISLSAEDLKKASIQDKEDIQDIQEIFLRMETSEREAFMEQELFCYTKNELVQWLDNAYLEGGI